MNKAVEFNKLKRKLDLLTEEHRILTNYLSLVEDALIQEVRRYIHPRQGRKRHCRRSFALSSSSTSNSLRFPSLSPTLTPTSLSSTSSSPILTPTNEKLDISFIIH